MPIRPIGPAPEEGESEDLGQQFVEGVDDVARQVGLTARQAGPVAAGAIAGGAMGSVIPGVGTAFGAGAGAIAMTILEIIDNLGGTNYIDRALDDLGLPRPESEEEQLVGAATKAMAGVGGVTGGAQQLVKGISKLPKTNYREFLEMLASNPRTAVISAIGGGGAGELARQEGAGPNTQLAATLAGGALAPAAVGVARKVGDIAVSTGKVIGAGFGSDRAVKSLTRDIALDKAGINAPRMKRAMETAPEHVPGAAPTAAEAIAGAQMNAPERWGGALVRLQKDLTGVKGAEDILPSAARQVKAAVESFIAQVKGDTAPMRKAALRAANQTGGIPAAPLVQRLSQLKNVTGLRVHSDRFLRETLNDIAKYVRKGALTLNADDLYAIRQKITVNMQKQLADGSMDKRAAMIAEKYMTQVIDDAIENAGGTGWKAYLAKYSEGMSKAEAHEARQQYANEIAKDVQSQQPGELARSKEVKAPTLLHRPMMALNFFLRMVARDANDLIVKEMATRMQDAKYFAELLARPPGTPARQSMEEVLARVAIISGLISKHSEDMDAADSGSTP